MEKQIVTTQTLDLKTADKAIKAASVGFSPFIIYIIIFCLFIVVNFSQIFLSDSGDTAIETDHYENVNATADPTTPWSELLVSLIPVFVFVIAFFFIKRFIKDGGLKKQFEKKARYFTNVTFTVNPDFLKVQGDGFENTHRWEEMHKVKETKEFYVLFSENTRVNIIDKAQLDPWQLEEIKEIFELIKPKVKVSLK